MCLNWPLFLSAQTITSYEATIASPVDSGSGPTLWYQNADSSTATGHMDSTGSASNQAFRLGGQTYTDYFGNADMAFGLAADETIAAAVSGSTNLFMTGAQGTVSLLFKTPSDMTGLQVLFGQGLGFELAVNSGTTRISYTSDGTKFANIGLALSADSWYYAALKWDTTKESNDLTWFLGDAGSETLATGSLNIDAAGGNTSITIAGRASSNFFVSPIQEFAVWDRELSTASIEGQYLALVPEPATYSLISGFIVLGVILIRRRIR